MNFKESGRKKKKDFIQSLDSMAKVYDTRKKIEKSAFISNHKIDAYV